MEQQNNENNNNDIPVQDTVHNVQTETVQDRANEVEKEKVTTTEVPVEQPVKDAILDPVKGKPEAIGVDKVVAMLEDADIDNPTILPGITSKDLTKLYEAYGNNPNIDDDSLQPEQINGFAVFNYGLRYHPYAKYNVLVDRLEDKKSTFTNQIVEEGKNTNIRTLSANDIKGSNLNQNLLLAQFMSELGAGEKTNIPLWHSGFRVVITPPNSNKLISLHNKIFKDKLLIGKDTLGISFSNDAGVLHKYFIEMFMSLIEGCTLDVPRSELLKYISVLDLNTIYLAVQASMSTTGIDIYTNCKNVNQLVDDTPVCNFAVQAKLDPTKLLWVDTSRLSNPMRKQVAIVSDKRVTVEQVEWYQKELTKFITKNTYDIQATNSTETMEVVFRIPNLETYLDESLNWLDDVSETVRKSLSEGYEDDERDNMIESVKYLMRLGTFNSYVDYINIRGNKLNKRDLVIQALITYGKTQHQIDDFLEAVLKFIEDSSVAIVGYPAFDCPKCKANNVVSLTDRLKEIIPLEISTLFFDLTARSLASQADR